MTQAMTTEADALVPLYEGPTKFAYSNSRIGTYEECPRKFKFEYVDKMQKGEMPPIVLVGGVVHLFIEMYFGRCREKNIDSDLDAVPMLIEKAFAEAQGLPQRYFEEVEQLCRTFVMTHRYDTSYTEGIELKIAIDKYGRPVDWMSKDVFLRGIVDYLRSHSGKVEITDWKTGWSTDYDPFQLKMYALLLSYVFPHVDQFEVGLDFVRAEKFVGESFMRDEIDRFKVQLRTAIKKIESDTEYKPRPGAACTYCPYFNVCPARAEIDVVRSDSDVNAAIEELALLERRTKDLKVILKAWCETAGVVRHHGIEMGYYPTEKMTIDAKAFVDLCEQMGVDPWKLVNVPMGNGKFRRLLRDAPPTFEQTLRVIANVEKGTRFAKKGCDEE